MNLTETRHPSYDLPSWEKYRLTFKGGTDFIKKYLFQRNGEEENEFKDRKAITYNPALAKSAVKNISNSIHQRVGLETAREGGTDLYTEVMNGQHGGVDLQHSSMPAFMGRKVLPELLSIGKVGVYVDRATALQDSHPYMYIYKAENILNWIINPDDPGEFLVLLLRIWADDLHETGLPTGEKSETFQLMRKIPEGVLVETYNKEGLRTSIRILDIPKIPLVVFEITESLLTDVADYQIALLNLASSDVSYAWTSNIPVYTEQSSPAEILNYMKQNVSDRVITDIHKKDTSRDISLSHQRGRLYGKGMDRPGFINPSSEPLQISMKLSDSMKDDIRMIINLSLTTIKPRAASAESKALDERGLEAGLSAIGLELEAGENEIAAIFADYEDTEHIASVKYPNKYELKSDEDRRKDAEEILSLKEKFPSPTVRKELSAMAAETLFGHRLKPAVLQQAIAELEAAKGTVSDAKSIALDIAEGLVSKKTAAVLRGYDSDEVKTAQEEAAAKQALVIAAQRGDDNFDNSIDDKGSRGEDKDPDK